MHDNLHLLRFSIGPVQPFIESARTVRDLWTGSYLLSWLTARAVAEVLNAEGIPVGKHLKDLPLVKLHRPGAGDGRLDEGALLRRSCLPNVFLAWYDGARTPDLPAKVEGAVREEWRRIADGVHDSLASALSSRAGQNGELIQDWDRGWVRQVSAHWDIRVLHQPPGQDWRRFGDLLGVPRREGENTDLLRIDLLGAMANVNKLIRHVRTPAERGDFRPKCNLTGEDEQMGGVKLPREARAEFWGLLSAGPIKGERIRAEERLGAPALVKRLAWACALAPQLRQGATAARNRDTATIAAASWLRAANLWSFVDDGEDWSGQWLHWREGMEADGEANPPDEFRNNLGRAIKQAGPPPKYYGILMMDGDGIGSILGKLRTPEDMEDVAAKLSQFALQTVPKVVQEHLGEDLDLNQPVYAGGDDVLAMVPLITPFDRMNGRTAVDLAAAIARAFGDLQLDGANRTGMSAGLAIVHYKEDLRVALRAAREAEQAAKRAGKNRLALAVLRRSGEHTTAVAPWGHADTVSRLVRTFMDARATDRWTYQLRAVMEDLPCADAVDVELARLLSRSRERSASAHDFHGAWSTLCNGGASHDDSMTSRKNALTLIQSASFIARGSREDR